MDSAVSEVGSRRPRGRLVAMLAGCLLAGVSAGVLASFFIRASHGSVPSTGTTPGAAVSLARRPAPPFTLTDQNGQSISLAAQKGQVVLLTFLDPQCRELCPVMGKDIGAVEQKLPSSVHPVLIIFSVAPART